MYAVYYNTLTKILEVFSYFISFFTHFLVQANNRRILFIQKAQLQEVYSAENTQDPQKAQKNRWKTLHLFFFTLLINTVS